MSCPHGNHPDACDICDEIAAAYKSGVEHTRQSYEWVSLTNEEYVDLAHRIASKYTHRTDPTFTAYTFLPHTLEQFVRSIEDLLKEKIHD